MGGYAIRDGQAGYDRLRVLAQTYRDNTVRLLARAGVGPGLHCVDLGCGGGAVSFELAHLVGDTGSVTALDLDDVTLNLARKQAADRGIANVSFARADVTRFDQPASYDVVYARFLLQHLSDPVDQLTRMWAAVRPGGRLIIEDADFDGCYSDPVNPGMQLFLRVYSQLLARRGGDATIGRRLFGYLNRAGVARPHLGVVEVVHSEGESKLLFAMTLAATKDAMVTERLVSTVDADEALASLTAFSADPSTIVGGPRIFQAWSAREA